MRGLETCLQNKTNVYVNLRLKTVGICSVKYRLFKVNKNKNNVCESFLSHSKEKHTNENLLCSSYVFFKQKRNFNTFIVAKFSFINILYS